MSEQERYIVDAVWLLEKKRARYSDLRKEQQWLNNLICDLKDRWDVIEKECSQLRGEIHSAAQSAEVQNLGDFGRDKSTASGK